MKRRYRYANSVEGDYVQKRIDENYFSGYVCHIKVKNVKEPFIVDNGISNICIKDENYEWVEVYPDHANYVITIMFDADKNLIEWYFDIAKEVGIKDGIPFEDDLYLDMVITPDGHELVLDEDELLNAYSRGEITQNDVNTAYQTLKDLEKIYVNHLEDLKKLTNIFCEVFNKEK